MKTDLVATGYVFSENKVLLIHHNKLNKWIPIGGHIDEGEIPDQTMKREVKEETNLDIEILNQSELPLAGSVKKALAIPFDVNIHNVGDHDHYSLFYICKALNPEEISLNNELREFKWFSKEELSKADIPPDVKNQALKAFEFIEKK